MDNDNKIDKVLDTVIEIMVENKEQSKDIEYLKIASDKRDEVIAKQEENLREQKVDLEYHIKRTDVAEQRLEILEHRTSLGFLAKTIGMFATAITAIYKLIDVLMSSF